MSNQAAYVRTLNRGMKQNGLIVISALNDASLATRQKEIVARLASVPGVKIATRSDIFPHHLLNNDDWTRVGQTQKHAMHWGKATPGYFDAIGARLIAGRFFDTQHGQDYVLSDRRAENGASIILSRLAAEQFGFSSPQDAIGQELREVGLPQTYRVIGVIDDIRFRGAKSRMAPLLYFGTSGPVSYVGALVRYSGASEHVEMDRLAKAWAEIAPDVAFSAESASDIFAEDYRSDASHSVLFGIGSAVAVGIASLGLYGLSAFNVSRRMQEIGIRKVLGAQTRDVLWLLVMQFLRPVMIASFVACPAAYLLMQVWLASFDERIALTPLPFIIVTLGALAIAVVTVLGQTLRAAIRSPAIALRQTI
nr:FtsX-like permease family protein [Acetobacter senegalensis]